MSKERDGAQGEVQLLALDDGRTITARFAEQWYEGAAGWPGDFDTEWSLQLDGRTFEVVSEAGAPTPLPLPERWKAVAPALTLARGACGRVHVRYSYAVYHHVGSSHEEIELVFDLEAMRVEVRTLRAHVDIG